MSAILNGLSGILCLIDDILILGKDQKDCNKWLNAGVNPESWSDHCAQSWEVQVQEEAGHISIGHVINVDGISADPFADFQKTVASQKWPSLPTLLINQLGKYSTQIASHSKPLRELWAPSTSGPGDQTKKMPLPELRQRWAHPVFWPCTTQWPLPRFHRMAWGSFVPADNPGMAYSYLRIRIHDRRWDSICPNQIKHSCLSPGHVRSSPRTS